MQQLKTENIELQASLSELTYKVNMLLKVIQTNNIKLSYEEFSKLISESGNDIQPKMNDKNDSE